MSARWGITPPALDELPDEVQAEMGALVVAEESRCPNGHSLLVAFDVNRAFLVDQETCLMCLAQNGVQEQAEKEMPPRVRGAQVYGVRVKHEGRGVGAEQ